MDGSIVTIFIIIAVLYFWNKTKGKTATSNGSTTTTSTTVNTGSVQVVDPLAGLQGPTNYNFIEDISSLPTPTTKPSEGPVTQVDPTSGQSYVVQPITIPDGESPYYWDEATWKRLFAANAFTNPETALAIYARRDPSNPEYR